MTNGNEMWNLNQSYLQLPKIFYTKVKPSTVQEPKMKVFNEGLAEIIGLNREYFQSKQGEAVLAGNEILPSSTPIAQAYAGHQFGYFTRLGDGRAILLGEQVTPSGETFDIQLKGAGRTPYSRGGDGRAALGPMLREYIISEAMHALGIPTTRSLAVVTTGESVIRENPLPGAILTRVASSHLRVGTFEYAVAWGSHDDLQRLANYTISRHHIEINRNDNPYVRLLEEVIGRQAQLIAKWQLVGFVHGVMNTDNMTISGETIDYGPCAFIDTYDRQIVFSSIDHEGRYAFENQSVIGEWNLSRFAETLIPLLHEEEEQAIQLAEGALAKYEQLFQTYFLTGMRAKLGIFNQEEADELLVKDFLNLMEKYRADYTNTFISLTFNTIDKTVLVRKKDFLEWYERWIDRRKRQEESEADSKQLMRMSNPAVIPRNHRVEEALEAAVQRDDYSVMNELLEVLSSPYAHTSKQTEYANVPEQTVPYVTFCGT